MPHFGELAELVGVDEGEDEHTVDDHDGPEVVEEFSPEVEGYLKRGTGVWEWTVRTILQWSYSTGVL